MTTSTWTGAFDTDTTNVLNWDNGVPTSTVDAIVDGTAPGNLVGSITCLSVSFTGFAANFNGDINVYGGDVTLASGMTITSGKTIKTFGDGNITSNGVTFWKLWNSTAHTRTMLDDLTLSKTSGAGSYVGAAGSTLARGAFDLTLDIVANQDQPVITGPGSITNSGGSIIYIVGSNPANRSTTYATIQSIPSISGTIAASDCLLAFTTADQNLAASITLTNSGVYCYETEQHIGGDITVIDSTFQNNSGTDDDYEYPSQDGILTIGGNFSATNTHLKNIRLNVTGSAIHTGGTNKTVQNCYMGGTGLNAIAATDGTGNTNVNFGVGTATFAGGFGDNWGIEQGAANANWSTGFTPTITNPVVFNGSSPDCTLDSDGYCASLDTSAYTGAFGNGSNIYVYGDFINGPDADFSATGGVSLRDDSTVTSNGGNCFAISVTPGITAAFADDLICQGFSVTGPGTIINQGANEITVTGGLTPDVAANVTWNYSAGAQINMSTAIASTLQGQSSATVVMPPIVVTGSNTLTVTRQFINCVSFDASAYTGAMSLPGGFHLNAGQLATTGDMTLGDSMTLSGFGSSATFICGGDLVVGCSIPASIWTVTGGASAPNGAAQTITGANFGGGTALEAPGCTDGTGNTNVNFTAPATVWDGSESTDAFDDDNWTPSGTPDATKDAEVNADAPSDFSAPGTFTARSLDFTGFVGEYLSSGYTLNMYGDLTFSSGMSFNNNGDISFLDDATWTMNGQHNISADYDAVYNVVVDSDAVLTLGDDVYNQGGFDVESGTIAFGANTWTVTTQTGDQAVLLLYIGTTVTYSMGASLVVAGNGGASYYSSEDTTLPPVVYNAPDALELQTDMHVDSLDMNSGDLTMATFTLKTENDLDISGSGTVSNGNLDVGGTATIHNRTVSDMTSTGDVDCLDGCIDGGGNDAHFLFPDISVPTIVSVTTDHANGEVAAAGTINIDVEFSELVNKTGTPQVIVLLHNNEQRLVNYTSGDGTDTYRFVYTVGAGDRFNALRVMAVILNGGTISDGTNDADLTMPDLTDYIIADGVGSATPSTGYEARTNHRRLGMVR